MASAGHALIDRELYLPQSWTGDRDRCRAAGVPDQVTFVTKPTLATRMLTRALDAGVVAGWVAGDEVYDADPKLRAALQARRLGYVLAVACDHRVSAGGDLYRADALAALVPAGAWHCISAGRDAKGYRCWMPRPVPLAILVRVAGCRWRIEEAFQASKGLYGLDEHQVRRWRSWYRWTTLAMLALAFLVVLAVTEPTHHPPPAGLAPLTCNELQHLFAALLAQPLGDIGHRLHWSGWRRRHQARARTCHDRRQATHEL